MSSSSNFLARTLQSLPLSRLPPDVDRGPASPLSARSFSSFAQSWLVYDLTKDPFLFRVGPLPRPTPNHHVLALRRGLCRPHGPPQDAARLAVYPDGLRLPPCPAPSSLMS